ncbi:MAG: hypothetical protein KRP56_03810 [Candidatus Methanogranum gryphiswaldense]|nr:MAG: hypothetical protein KRP56_03810 [Candidatus Methanogranum sp. U3.2.1]
MKDDNSIDVIVDSVVKHTIKEDMKINAKNILDILSFEVGDTYKITSTNNTGKNEDVVRFFCQLLEDIIAKIKIEFSAQVE